MFIVTPKKLVFLQDDRRHTVQAAALADVLCRTDLTLSVSAVHEDKNTAVAALKKSFVHQLEAGLCNDCPSVTPADFRLDYEYRQVVCGWVGLKSGAGQACEPLVDEA